DRGEPADRGEHGTVRLLAEGHEVAMQEPGVDPVADGRFGDPDAERQLLRLLDRRLAEMASGR
ncbi:MAG: hypothetical protein ACNA8P_13560, partial [Phycisphaerales bacterium]